MSGRDPAPYRESEVNYGHSGRRDRKGVSREPEGDSHPMRGARGPMGFTNLVVEHKENENIIFDPHVTGECVLIFDETAANALFNVLRTWLR